MPNSGGKKCENFVLGKYATADKKGHGHDLVEIFFLLLFIMLQESNSNDQIKFGSQSLSRLGHDLRSKNLFFFFM